MKKINNVVRSLLVAVMCFGVVTPGSVFAASLSVMPIGVSVDDSAIVVGDVLEKAEKLDEVKGGSGGSGSPVAPRVVLPGNPFSGDARVIVANDTASYVADWSNFNLVTLDNSTMTPTDAFGPDSLGLALYGTDLYVAGGRSAGWMVCTATLTPSCGVSQGDLDATYEKVVVDGGGVYLGRLSSGGVSELEIDGVSTISLEATASEINALSKSANYIYAAQDATTGGVVSVVKLSDNSVASYSTSSVATAVTSDIDGVDIFYVGYGNNVDIVNASTLASSATIDTGSAVNGLDTDGTHLYVASDTGLKVYKLADNSLVGEFVTPKKATAVSVAGDYIYLATSDGADSEIFKIKMVVITLNGANPQAAELGTTYGELGATASDDSAVTIDASDVNMNVIGDYSVTYTAGSPGLSVSRTVQVRDTVGPVITLTGENPQIIRQGVGYTELGATTDDGSVVVIDTSDFADVVGSYTITYDAVDASGNNAVQVTRRVNVIGPTSGGGSGSSGGGSGSGSIAPRVVPPTAGTTEGQVLGATKYTFTLLLRMWRSPYPTGAYANEVMELQKFLNAAPYNSGLVVDGKFGPLTRAAVVKFQLANPPLVGDGIVGPLTRAVLNK